MKPRTRFQHKVAAANERLQPIKDKAVEWAFRHTLNHYAFRSPKGLTTCLDCGHKWHETGDKKCLCPKCGAELEISDTLRRKAMEKTYCSVLEIQDGMQILRTFHLTAKYHKSKAAEICIREIVRHWLDENGKSAVTGLCRTVGYYLDCFARSEIELRQDSDVYQHIANFNLYPEYDLIPQLRRNGLNDNFYDIAPQKLMKTLLYDSRMETLLKMGQIRDLKYFIDNEYRLNECWAAYKIATRNKYRISDIRLWADYVSMLLLCGKDIRNAYYVCPKNLRNEHDKYQKKIQAIRQREWEKQQQEWLIRDQKRREAEMQKAIKQEQEFKEMKGKYFGLQFTDGLIVVSVLDSIEAHYEEGKAMHHCVGSSNYCLNPQSLIMSARIDGKRVETVELSLSSFEILQSRGVCNQTTEYHDQIIALVRKNVNQVRRLAAA